MRHERDGGGSAAAPEEKRALRDRVSGRLEREGTSRIPGARGRIPDSAGAEEAVDRPEGVDWSLLDEEKIRSIPLLRRLRREAGPEA